MGQESGSSYISWGISLRIRSIILQKHVTLGTPLVTFVEGTAVTVVSGEDKIGR